MIDREVKRSLGQMIKGIEVVGSASEGRAHLYTSHWVSQVSFEEPIVQASVSPKHDTHALIVVSGLFTVSVLAADQVAEGQWFSYPGRRFQQALTEYVEDWDGLPVVPNAISYLRCEVFDRRTDVADHDLFLARVVAVRAGRLKEPPLLYSSRLGWRATGDKVREPGQSVRDRLLERFGEVDLADDE